MTGPVGRTGASGGTGPTGRTGATGRYLEGSTELWYIGVNHSELLCSHTSV